MTKTIFGQSAKKQARDLHYDIVKNLFELARKVTVIEKFQSDSSVINANSIIKKSEPEILADRLANIQWDVYNMPFIVINEDQKITPIYRRVDQIPEPIREFSSRIFKKAYKEYDEMKSNEIVE
jgi:hypothetical protein